MVYYHVFLSVSLGVEFCFLTNQSLLNHLDWLVDCFAEIQEHGIKKVNPSITFLILNYYIFFNNLTFNISIANGTSMPLNNVLLMQICLLSDLN
jgi:hypothetical protein